MDIPSSFQGPSNMTKNVLYLVMGVLRNPPKCYQISKASACLQQESWYRGRRIKHLKLSAALLWLAIVKGLNAHWQDFCLQSNSIIEKLMEILSKGPFCATSHVD